MQTTLIVKAVTGFCKGKKICFCRVKKHKIPKNEVVHKVPGSFTRISGFISKLYPMNNFRQDATNKVNLFHEGIAAKGKTNERICLGTPANGDDHMRRFKWT
jgi:hypothetical protein